jgi:hypothetical protein
MQKWTERFRKDPTPWLLDKSCPPIRYRTLTEIHGHLEGDADATVARHETYNYQPACKIASQQSDDGTWFNSLVGFEATNVQRRRGPGTASQYHALIEYGWTKDHPIVWRTAELLQALLWEDPTIDLLELKGYCGGDPKVEAYLRKSLSWRALALLARSSFADDAGVQRKSAELLAQLDDFYRGPIHEKLITGTLKRTKEGDDGPYEEVCTVMTKAVPLPDHALLLLFAFNPALRRAPGAQDFLSRLVTYLFEHPAPENPVIEVGGKVFDRDMDLAIRTLDLEAFCAKKCVGRLLQELEVLARCGVLLQVPKAVGLLEWLISLQDEEGVVRADDFIEKHQHRVDYPYFPLEDNWRGKHKKYTDLTFRLLLILSILDRQAAA